METKVLRNRVNIPMFVAYRLHMEFNGDASRFERAMQEVIFCSYWSDDEDFRLVTDKPTILYDEFIKEKEERNKVFFLDKYLGC